MVTFTIDVPALGIPLACLLPVGTAAVGFVLTLWKYWPYSAGSAYMVYAMKEDTEPLPQEVPEPDFSVEDDTYYTEEPTEIRVAKIKS